ncbi:structural maintenance of chromosomes protein 3 [Nephila pilipes]|uniref:Structural maintenance of chromosomes protein 3 n=1 Tax=Nephila pilipes TaxID=299642 RepID=A0A8X6T9I6_NEPPI|nr:structural maintenance of chromosomes protein 3 [Nephila pilipes]
MDIKSEKESVQNGKGDRIIKETDSEFVKFQEDLEKAKEKKNTLEIKIEGLTEELENHREDIDNQNKNFHEMKRKEDSLQNKRNELWKQENATQQNLAVIKELSIKDQGLRSLSVTDRNETNKLNDDFRKLTQGTKEALQNGMMLEAEKNKVKNLLNDPLYRKEELEVAFREISMEDRRRKLDNSNSELVVTKNRIRDVNKSVKDLEQKFVKLNSEQKHIQKNRSFGKYKKEISRKK